MKKLNFLLYFLKFLIEALKMLKTLNEIFNDLKLLIKKLIFKYLYFNIILKLYVYVF